eukprot:14315589-Alexandrium_andersonii.AAC.1
MSASLVGSEMCIRDRLKLTYIAFVRQRRHEGHKDAKRDRSPLRAGPGAVSYTHLTLPTICSV